MTNEELQQAIAWFENRLSSATMPGARKMLGIALSALREKMERQKPNPLTLDALREIDGKPVYIVLLKRPAVSHWDIVRLSKEDGGPYLVRFAINYRLQENGYGKTWLAYRSEPKEAANE